MTEFMSASRLQEMIEAGMPGARIMVVGDDGRHFQAVVVSAAFTGLSAVRRHQLVYAALGDAMREQVHALSLATHTPDEWAERGN
jgi:acid stress-induced BolA-like protein IbaG/YrbA